MAVFFKQHPTLANRSRSFIGKTLDAYTIDLAVNATDFSATEMGPNGAVQEVIRVLSKIVTIVGHSELRADGGANAGQVFDVYVEGDFGTDTYDGSNSETLATHLQDEIRALTAAGTRSAALAAATGETTSAGGTNLNAATVTRATGFPLFANVA